LLVGQVVTALQHVDEILTVFGPLRGIQACGSHNSVPEAVLDDVDGHLVIEESLSGVSAAGKHQAP
jgi:hypothetical protein